MSFAPKVLLIDDERDILSGLSTRLRAHGMDVYTECDASKGLASAALLRPNLILMDLGMPRMDGFELLSRLKQDPMTSGIPVVVLSANVVEKSRSRALSLGARKFLEKPFQSDKLLSVVLAELCGQRDLPGSRLN